MKIEFILDADEYKIGDVVELSDEDAWEYIEASQARVFVEVEKPQKEASSKKKK